MKSIKIHEQNVWVRLNERGEKHVCEFAAHCERVWSKPGLAKRIMAHEMRQDGWHEYPFSEFMRLFGSIMGDGLGSPFVDNEVFLEQPF